MKIQVHICSECFYGKRYPHLSRVFHNTDRAVDYCGKWVARGFLAEVYYEGTPE